jgi:hypothetical protein
MGRTNVGSTDDSPSRIKPHLGQVSEYAVESSRSERWRVFHERVARSYFANDPGHLHPEAGAGAVESSTFAGDADVLAGKPARYHVNKASPWASVKGANVIPNRERRENAVILSGDKYACGVWVELDGADGSPPEEMAAEYSATSARE